MLLVSVVLYSASQLVLRLQTLPFAVYFDVLPWQILFFGGLALGFHRAALVRFFSSIPVVRAVLEGLVVAVALAFLGRFVRMREASQLAIVLLVLTGAKVVAQDLRTGTAAMMFIALAVYGSAMLAIAKTRGSATDPNTAR